jgi:hypothetical protein
MPLSIVSQVIFGADAAHARGAFRRPSPPPQRPTPAGPAATDAPLPEALQDDGEDGDERPASTAGLSILAHALAAYSQN